MILITDKDTNVILNIGEGVKYWDNGYPVLLPQEAAYIKEEVNVYEADIPEGVEPYKNCYTEKDGFFDNPNYISPNNPYGVPNEIVDKIQEDTAAQIMTDVASKGVTAVE